jgi:hypothetical protein
MNAKITRTINRIGLQIKKHSPEIMMVAGIAGTVVSAVMACKATTKIDDILNETKNNVDKIHAAEEKGQITTDKDGELIIEEYTADDCKKDISITYAKTGLELAKIYAPAVVLGAISIASILAAHNILRKRNVALMAAYTAIDNNFKDYRKRVITRFGEKIDKELKCGVRTETVTETIVDENGEEKTVEKNVTIIDDIASSEYRRVYDAGNDGWEKDADHNLYVLRSVQNWANDVLQSRGHIFLNELYDQLGYERTKAGQIVGWVYRPDDPDYKGDGYVDFGIYDYTKQENRNFLDGDDPTVILTFNVDGPIYDLI